MKAPQRDRDVRHPPWPGMTPDRVTTSCPAARTNPSIGETVYAMAPTKGRGMRHLKFFTGLVFAFMLLTAGECDDDDPITPTTTTSTSTSTTATSTSSTETSTSSTETSTPTTTTSTTSST